MQSYAFFINDAICYRYQMRWCVCFSSKFEWIYRTFTSNKLEFLRGDRNGYILCSNFWSSEDRPVACSLLGGVLLWMFRLRLVVLSIFVFFIYIMRHNMRLHACWLPTCQSQVAEQWGLRLWLTWGPRFAVWTSCYVSVQIGIGHLRLGETASRSQ